MDFDPSEFLDMAMTEDQDAVYSAGLYWDSVNMGLGFRPPDLPHPDSYVQTPPGSVTVEGGLQMEQGLQISVPTFGMLDLHNEHELMEDDYDTGPLNENKSFGNGIEEPLLIDSPEPDNTTTSQPSPSEGTASPHVVKKVIPTSYDETRFRKEFFAGVFERVKLFRLHCTICDKHLGCAPFFTERQMRNHKLLSVAVCRKCFEFYGDVNFPLEDDSEMYCCWCGQGGELFCCSSCPKTVCKNCIGRNFGTSKIKEIDQNDNWECFVCKPVDIWPHRAMMWGLQRFGREMRQHFAWLSKEERIAKLSQDTSHCCPNLNEKVPSVSLPNKATMSKVPSCMIAVAHTISVRNQPEQKNFGNYNTLSVNKVIEPTLNSNIAQQMNQNLSHLTRMPGTAPHRQPTPQTGLIRHPTIQNFFPSSSPRQQFMCRGAMNRFAPYQLKRQMTPVQQSSPQLPYPRNSLSTVGTRPTTPHRSLPQPNQSLHPNEVIDLVEESPLKHKVSNRPESPSHDISWMEKGVKNVGEMLSPLNLTLHQFHSHKNDFTKDFPRLISFSESFSEKIKMAIYNLAKINQDIVDAKKWAIDNKVTSIVNDIKLNGMSNSISINEIPNESVNPNATKVNVNPKSTTVNSSSSSILKKTLQVMSDQEPEQITPPSTSAAVEVGDLSPALLCETVLEVEGNKENDSGNKSKTTPVKSITKKPGMSNLRTNVRKPDLFNKKPQTEIPVINLIDEDEVNLKFDESYYCRKFNIKPCKVLLKKCIVNIK